MILDFGWIDLPLVANGMVKVGPLRTRMEKVEVINVVMKRCVVLRVKMSAS